MTLSESDFRRLVGRFATGVTVVTTRRPGGYHGLTVNAFCSLSLEPQMVLISIDSLNQSLDYVRETGAFAVNILSRGQQFLADRFAGRAPLVTNFGELPHHVGALDVPLLDDALAWIECRVAGEIETGDHIIVLGTVVGGAQGAGSEPLLYQGGQFARIAPGV
ncbi:MAG: flavin reductase family protein [Chloroflexi bacterium]|nr:flavin reductase family protein [Chloroflexota bacterium]